MKKNLYITLFLFISLSVANAQSNYLDNYIGNTVTLTTIGNISSQVDQPRDLDFKPYSNELWICNYGDANGGSNVIFYNAGLTNQTSEYRKDTHTSHFMRFPSAMAFGDDGKWAAVSEILNTNSGTFMGPALWSSDTSITASVFQNNWLPGSPLGSHLDMLHQSPFAMGIAHDSATAYWVMDGHFGSICKYDFDGNHGPGYDDHSNGKIWRYTDVPVTRVAGIPSHMVLDKLNHWLYFIDGVSKTIKRMDTGSGSFTSNLTAPNETLALYVEMTGATVEDLDTLTTQPCGIDYYNGRLIVSDHTTGDIYLYNTTGAFTLMGTIVTGHPGMMGVKVGPDGHIWCVNHTDNAVYRLDVTLPATDAAITAITSPAVENTLPPYFSTSFNVCDGNITPEIIISNNGTNTITSIDMQYSVDGGAPVSYSLAGSVAPGTTALVSFPSSTVSNGNHLLMVEIISVNGASDEVDLNNKFAGSFRAFTPVAALPFTEEFSAVTFPPAGWNNVNFNPNNKMSRVASGGFGLSVGCLKMDNYSGQMDITGQKDYLMLPLIDFTPANANTFLRFNVAYAKYNSGSTDRLQVLVSTDCGVTWTPVYDKAGTALSTAPVTTSAFTPNATQWRTDSVIMGAYAGQTELMIAFASTSNFGNNFYVDDIFIGGYLTEIAEPETENTISIFPNPAASVLHLTISEQLTTAGTMNIFSADGKLVKSFSIPVNKNVVELDIADLENGIYVISINSDRNVLTRRIVKL